MRIKPPFRVLSTKGRFFNHRENVWSIYGLRIGVDPWGTFIQHGLVQTIIWNHCGSFNGDFGF